jgi:hypothetical protein
MDIGPIFTEDILPALREAPASDGSPQRGWPNAQCSASRSSLAFSAGTAEAAALAIDARTTRTVGNSDDAITSSDPPGHWRRDLLDRSLAKWRCRADGTDRALRAAPVVRN